MSLLENKGAQNLDYIFQFQLSNSWEIQKISTQFHNSTLPTFRWDNIVFQISSDAKKSAMGAPVPWEELLPDVRQKIILIHSFLWRNTIPFNYYPYFKEDQSTDNEMPALPKEVKNFLENFHFEKTWQHENLFLPSSEWCFFGGTFNPWHPGHSACISLCEANPIFILPDNNPLKMINRPLSESLADMWAQQDLRVKGIPYLGFVANYRPNPTYPWIQKIRAQNELKILSLLLGMDSFVSFTKWFMAEELVKLLNKFYVAPRSMDDISESISEGVEAQENAFQKTCKWMRLINPSLEITLLPRHPFEKLSSTRLREKINFHKSKNGLK
ncbi:MAG: hypothetical protein QE271_02235 [Bacteriovoracaceae bacterium]|nr:hypothetical protein [Bacteriovoracaceae bacterium]